MTLLDTHTWIWLVQGDAKLKKSKAFSRIIIAGDRSELCISAMSFWEIAMLESKNRLTLGGKPLDWIHSAISLTGARVQQISPEIAVDSANLPGNFHGDPGDRMIVATARVMGYQLATRDENIIAFGKSGYCKVLPV